MSVHYLLLPSEQISPSRPSSLSSLSRSTSQDLDLLTLDLSFSDLPSFTPNGADPVQPNPKVVVSTPDQFVIAMLGSDDWLKLHRQIPSRPPDDWLKLGSDDWLKNHTYFTCLPLALSIYPSPPTRSAVYADFKKLIAKLQQNRLKPCKIKEKSAKHKLLFVRRNRTSYEKHTKQ
ncbi:hypothetical protein L2E82_24469 [Cichorium intybus]|uniref:Uncharacterized protein n=1 Tax=Cichorium intybus TaxID=13427 RepID=A0ACB9E0Y0_CICIN|nr:hypothetical protein L2E82_24469 [Cichorium intybus]